MAITDLRLFIDEVGNSDLRGAASDPNIRYLSLTGVLTTAVLHDGKLTALANAAKRLLPAHSEDRPVILHRREIVRREGPFSALRDRVNGPTFDAALFSFISKSPYIATTVQIDKKAHLEAYSVWHFDPYHYCLRCLVERFVLYAHRHHASGLVVIEPRYKKSDKKLKASYEAIYKNGTEKISARTIQRHLLSRDLVFQPKQANIAGLQLADLIAHPSARAMRFDRDGVDPPADFGTLVANELTSRLYARCPRTSVINGWGTKWLP